jgi:RNA polymerase sigma-70 factor (ECF subfamily)
MKPPLDQSNQAPASVTSVTLLERVKGREPEAWQRLIRLYGPLVFQWCRRWELSPEDAADVSQEVFQSLASHIATFEHGGPNHSFRAWLWTITRNKINDHFRKEKNEPRAAGGTDAQLRLLAVPEQLPDDDASAAATTDLVHRALELIHGEFEERTWQMFWRSAVAGQLPRDIAKEMGVSPDAVRMAKSRILRRLREELE